MPAHIALSNCRIYRPVELSEGVEVVVAGRGLRRFPARVSDGLGVCVKFGGGHEVEIEGRRVVYPADSVSLRAPGCVWSSAEGMHGFVSIDVSPGLLPPDAEGKGMAFIGRASLPDVAEAARGLVEADDPLAADEILTQMLNAVFSTAAFASDSVSSSAGPARAVDDACAFLRASADGRPTLEETAMAAGMSKFALLRRFRAELGTTPHAYLVMLRVNLAQSLLVGGASPAEAALAAGFSDQAHLGLWFRRLLGVTPAGYRRQVRAGVAISS
jgi:AraC-like DNA-binding protein